MSENATTSSDRISASYFNQPQEDAPFRKLYVHIFYEDVQAIVPYRSHRSKIIRIVPFSDLNMRTVFDLFCSKEDPLSRRRLDTYEFEQGIQDFIRRTGADLAYFGILHWEIVSLEAQNAKSEKAPIVKQLCRIPGEVQNTREGFRQLIPPTAQPEIGRKYSEIPSSKVWSLAIPRRFGKPQDQKHLIEKLAQLSDLLPNFVSKDLDKEGPNPKFDVKSHSRQTLVNIAKLMKTWGWLTSQWREDENTEYYWVYRQLCFYSSLAFLRNYIVDCMNDLLKQLEVHCEIHLEGLPDEVQILALIEDLKQGKKSFNEALNFIYQIE